MKRSGCALAILQAAWMTACSESTGRFGTSQGLVYGVTQTAAREPVPNVQVQVSLLDRDCTPIIAGGGTGHSGAAGGFRVPILLYGWGAAPRCVRVVATPLSSTGLAEASLDTTVLFFDGQPRDSVRIDFVLDN